MRTVAMSVHPTQSLAEWQAAFDSLQRDFSLVNISDPDIRPEDVEVAVVFRPPHGRLASFPELRLIVSLGAGVDHLLADPQLPRGVPIVRMAAPETMRQMTDYVAWACLSLLRDLPRLVQAREQRKWDTFVSGRTAADCRVGILGLGNMGRAAALSLVRLGFPVSGWSRTLKELPGVATFSGSDALRTVVAESDILVAMLPATRDLVHLLDRNVLGRLPQGASLVNVGRGEHLVLADLLAELDEGRMSGAILDVLPQEPLSPDDPLWRHPKIFLTPHLASIVSIRGAAEYAVSVVAALDRGEALPNLYDPARSY